MDQPHNKKFKNMDDILVGNDQYLELLYEMFPEKTVTDDTRFISVKDLNDFIIRVNYWNLRRGTIKIKNIKVLSTYDKNSHKTTTALLPVDKDGNPVMEGPGGPADGPSYIS